MQTIEDLSTLVAEGARSGATASAAHANEPSFVLEIVHGPDTGARILVDPGQPQPQLVGASPACALRLSDRHVSRRHLSVEATRRGLQLCDLDSRNGTWVNH